MDNKPHTDHTHDHGHSHGHDHAHAHTHDHAGQEPKSILGSFLLEGPECCGGGESSLSPAQHLMSGAVAGIVEHTAIFPLDTIKTRMQTHPIFANVIPENATFCHHSHSHGQNAHHVSRLHTHGHSHQVPSVRPQHAPGALHTAGAIIKGEGIRKLFRGITAMAMGAGPSHAVYFATYEQVRKVFGADAPGYHPWANAMAGASATIVGDALLAPMDTVKQRMQVRDSPYRHVGHVLSSMLKNEGPGSLYASYPTTLLMNIPFCAFQFATYHSLKEFMNVDSKPAGSTDSIMMHWMCGGAAGAFAAGITTPMDVIRTTLQTQGLVGRVGADKRYRGPSEAARVIFARDGLRGFTRGWGPRVLFHFPGTAICWSTYELCKDYFGMQ